MNPLLLSLVLAQVIPWRAETLAIPSFTAADVAIVDDGVFPPWVVGADASQVGLYVYELDGGVRQVLTRGGVRGVDARGRFVVSTASTLQQLELFERANGVLTPVLDAVLNVPTPGEVALATTARGLEAWVDVSSPEVRRYAFAPDGGAWSAALEGSVQLATEPSGLVVDDRTGRLYAAVPAHGVFVVERGSATPEPLVPASSGDFGGAVGGVALYPLPDGSTLLLTTVPALDEVVVHRVVGSTATLAGRFEVGAPDGGAARATSPAYVTVSQAPSREYPHGLLVIHSLTTADYKLVAWEDVASGLSPPLPIVTGGVDAGVDGGAGPVDAGSGGGGGGSGGIGAGGGSGSGQPAPGAEPSPTGCGCTGAPVALLPALLAVWWIRRSRS